jgi:Cu/Ag efflux pump CusA
VSVDPVRLAATGLPLERVVAGVRAGNDDVGGRLLEQAGAEYMIRGRGYASRSRTSAASSWAPTAPARPCWCSSSAT